MAEGQPGAQASYCESLNDGVSVGPVAFVFRTGCFPGLPLLCRGGHRPRAAWVPQGCGGAWGRARLVALLSGELASTWWGKRSPGAGSPPEGLLLPISSEQLFVPAGASRCFLPSGAV